MATGKELDVYAEPYIPLILKQVNSAPAHFYSSQEPPWINFDSYVLDFAGRFLTARPRPSIAISPPQDTDPLALNADTYSRFFSAALDLEISALQNECEQRNLYQVGLFQMPGDVQQAIYRLLVPGLRENNILLEIGDTVHIRQLQFDAHGGIVTSSGIFTNNRGVPMPGSADICHLAVVWAVDRLHETLHLRIDYLHQISGLYNACFTLQDARIGALQVALGKVAKQVQQDNSWLRSMLFPKTKDGKLQTTLNTSRHGLQLFDLDLNNEQGRAIQTVLRDDYGRVPYLISGPPGTGKTKTVVELALQILAQDETKHLLLCAPSESAADTLTQRLRAVLSPKDLLRLNSPARSFAEVSNTILPYCFVDGSMFSLPPFADFMAKQVVVTTTRDAELLIRARLTNADLCHHEAAIFSAHHPRKSSPTFQLHWDALILDEAAQATELEALIPLLVIAPPSRSHHIVREAQVVMVGDPNQLGPRTASKIAELQTSLFERLLKLPLYMDHPLARAKQHGGHVPRLTSDMLPLMRPPFTDLIRNYRSHPAILAIPSSLFYHDTLEPHAQDTEALLVWPGFEGRDLPVLFHENRGQDEIEQDGGGWFNLEEADIAVNHARSFVDQGVAPRDICIMSPFRAQVKVLRTRARVKGLGSVNIGPLEAYQGLEFRVAIVCTTRSRRRFIDQDLARGLGVIHESKRFNVALTRAKQALVVIGNPDALDEDLNWAAFLAFCQRNGAWKGTGDYVWTTPHAPNIRRSRLEKQLQARHEVSLEAGVRRLGLSGDAEAAAYEAGVTAEEAVLEDFADEEEIQQENT